MSDKLTMFGKVFTKVGEQGSNLVLLTQGDVKIKTAGQFVTIFKNGKLCVDEGLQIYTVDSEDSISKTGIYVVTTTDDDGNTSQSVYLCIDGTKILLACDTDGYISYTSLQSLTADQFLVALQNLGFYFQTLDEAESSGITSGLVYILDDQVLYKVVDGVFTPYSATSSESGSTTSESSTDTAEETSYDNLQIGAIYICGDDSYIDTSESVFTIMVGGNSYIIFRNNNIYPVRDIVLDSKYQVYTKGAVMGESGFMIYTLDGETYLEVDNLIVHNSSSEDNTSMPVAYIGTEVMNMISSASWVSAPTQLSLTLKYTNNFAVGDVVAVQMSGGNTATLAYDSILEDENDDTSDTIPAVKITLDSQLTQTTVIKIYYTTEDDDDNESTKYVEVTIEPTVYDDEEEEYIANLEVYAALDIDDDEYFGDFTSAEVISGDTDLAFDLGGEDSSEITSISIAAPILYYGTVTSISTSTIEINVPSNSLQSSSVLTNLEGTLIYRITTAADTKYIIYYYANNLTLLECYNEDSGLIQNIRSRIGDLSSIANPLAGSTDSTGTGDYLQGYGIYSDNLHAVKGTYYGATHELDYPVYGESLELPDDVENEQYDSVIPDIAWVKALIKATVTSIVEELLENYTFSGSSNDSSSEEEVASYYVSDMSLQYDNSTLSSTVTSLSPTIAYTVAGTDGSDVTANASVVWKLSDSTYFSMDASGNISATENACNAQQTATVTATIYYDGQELASISTSVYREADSYTVTATGTGCSVEPESQTVPYGGSATIVFTEEESYTLSESGIAISGTYGGSSYSNGILIITNVQSDLTIVAAATAMESEEETTYTFAINASPENATITINGEQTSSVEVTEGTEISWSVAATGYIAQSGTYTMGSSDYTLEVTLTERSLTTVATVILTNEASVDVTVSAEITDPTDGSAYLTESLFTIGAGESYTFRVIDIEDYVVVALSAAVSNDDFVSAVDLTLSESSLTLSPEDTQTVTISEEDETTYKYSVTLGLRNVSSTDPLNVTARLVYDDETVTIGNYELAVSDEDYTEQTVSINYTSSNSTRPTISAAIELCLDGSTTYHSQNTEISTETTSLYIQLDDNFISSGSFNFIL